MAKKNLTKKQKEVLVKRLEKARAAKKPAKLKTVHPSVRELPDDDLFSYANVKEWQKITQMDRRFPRNKQTGFGTI